MRDNVPENDNSRGFQWMNRSSGLTGYTVTADACRMVVVLSVLSVPGVYALADANGKKLLPDAEQEAVSAVELVVRGDETSVHVSVYLYRKENVEKIYQKIESALKKEFLETVGRALSGFRLTVAGFVEKPKGSTRTAATAAKKGTKKVI